MSVLLLPSQLADIEHQKAEDGPVYIVGEGVECSRYAVEGYGRNVTDCPTKCQSSCTNTPPAGWPAVGERVQCETCDGDKWWLDWENETTVTCFDCNGEGATLPRVELTVTCPECQGKAGQEVSPGRYHFCFNCEDEGVPWGSALWQTLPVVGGVLDADAPLPMIWQSAVGHPWLFDNEGSRVIPLDPASVRPGSFVAILTDIEQA